jgi:hypothetical protein
MNAANGRKSNGKWVDRWREGGRHRQRTFDRRGDRDAFRLAPARDPQPGGGDAQDLPPAVGQAHPAAAG